ncbi:methyl-accepting chemotaxis protein [Lacimicrobium alkaliphilum]|uniref:Methyl-accepting chemotaxis protein n=2 Tax=Lacimicrobium alkaliphilum TaxID=1526571 RepID=A0ABQ1RFH8_9ALTE|nr:methyl-accepting chemotaxis protein [Lacimicrobium alkaliphilum]
MKKLDAINDVAMGFVDAAYREYQKGALSKQEAMQHAIDKLEQIRYEGSEYIFVYGRDGMLIMDPSLPTKDRFKANFYDFEDPEGTPLFQHMIERTQDSKRATVNYVWELPDSSKIAPKMSRVVAFDQWNWIIGTGVYMNHVSDQVWSLFWRISGLILLFSIPVLILFFVIVNSVVTPLKASIAAMKNIADGDGDLTRRLKVDGKDELAQLAQAFNAFANQVRDLVEQVSGSTTTMNQSVLQLNGIMKESETGVDRQQQETDQVATAMNQMTATAQEVASSASKASNAAGQAEHQVVDSKNVLNKAIEVIGGLSEQVSEGVIVIENLGKDSENIGSVLDVIRGIAEQTNLLALNAAIEAARAGEAGRGFAVVADEVRTLASRTQKSTQEIQAMIESLQQRAQKAVTVIDAISERSLATVGEARLVDEALVSIEQAVNTINSMNAQIASAAEEQTSVSETINQNIFQIAEITEQTSQGTRQASDATQKLTELAAQLDGLVKDYKY